MFVHERLSMYAMVVSFRGIFMCLCFAYVHSSVYLCVVLCAYMSNFVLGVYICMYAV